MDSRGPGEQGVPRLKEQWFACVTVRGREV